MKALGGPPWRFLPATAFLTLIFVEKFPWLPLVLHAGLAHFAWDSAEREVRGWGILISFLFFVFVGFALGGPWWILGTGVVAAWIGLGPDAPWRLRVLTAVLVALPLPLAVLSGEAGGAGGWVRWLMQFGISFETIDQIVFWGRKGVHFGFYGALAGVAWAWFCAINRWIVGEEGDVVLQIATPLLLALSFAAFDEARQWTTPGRSGSWVDVALDLAGAITVLGYLVWRSAKR